MNNSKHEAAIPNPALKPYSALIGEWKTVGTHLLLPDLIVHGRTSFNWMEEGAFLIMHAEMEEEEIPDSIAILGSDDTTGACYMLYFDERKVSRKIDVEFKDNVLKWWRNAPEFSQRCAFTFTDGGNTIISKGEISKDGKTWEKDLDLTYTRIQ